MKNASVVVLSLFTAVIVLAPMASEAAEQQNEMKVCNEQANATGLGEGKGDERKKFVSTCLSNSLSHGAALRRAGFHLINFRRVS